MAKLSEEERDSLSREPVAFPQERKEPLNDAAHIRNAVARFDRVKDVSNTERDAAWRRLRRAAKKYWERHEGTAGPWG